jgi:hypothetical protein
MIQGAFKLHHTYRLARGDQVGEAKVMERVPVVAAISNLSLEMAIVALH